MDKDYLLDLMVNVRERLIPVDEAVETICALADDDTGEKQCNLPVVTPRFCFVCGTKLEEVGLGWMQCKSEKCGEVFLPFKDVDGNQNLMLQNTPFTPNEG